MSNKFAAIAAKAAEVERNMTEAKAGGADIPPLAAGPCRLRLVGYIELGKHESEYQGVKKTVEKVKLIFEVSGPKHPPRVVDGTTYPNLIFVEENLSLSDKARFFKLFGRLNHAGKATHCTQLLGEGYKGVIIHRKYAKRGEDKAKPETWTGIAVELFDKAAGSYTIDAPRVEDAETGEWKPITVAEATVPLQCFVWNLADMDQWQSIFIEGEWPERKDKDGKVTAPAASKNVNQNQIKRALNFAGSPIYELLANNGQSLDIPDAERPGDEPDPTLEIPGQTEAKAVIEKASAAAKETGDALNGIV